MICRKNYTDSSSGLYTRSDEMGDCAHYLSCLNAACKKGAKYLPCVGCKKYEKAPRVRANAYVQQQVLWENF